MRWEDAGTAGVPPAPVGGEGGVWHSRLYLPHFESPGAIQMITFRLGDSLPVAKAEEIRNQAILKTDAQRRRRLEELLDAGYGVCHLQNPVIARLVENAFSFFDGQRYHMQAWVVMPNHVHFMMETISGYSLPDVLHSLKSFTAKRANKLLGRTGQFWQAEYFDRAIRDEKHWLSAVEYIHMNPVKAGLVQKAEDWRYSSARLFAQTYE